MQFDKTQVTIRQRGPAEIADLAILVLQRYGVSLLGVWAVGVLPFFLLNTLILGWIPYDAVQRDLMDDELFNEHTRYLWLMSVLVFLQAPWGCSLITIWLGRAVFQHRPSWREVYSDFKATFWRAFWVLGILRGPLPVIVLLASNWGQELAVGREVVWMIFIALFVGVWRLARPYVPEIIVLERCSLRGKGKESLSARKRSALLHTPASGEVSSRAILTGVMALAGVLMLTFSLVFFRTYLAGRMGWGLDMSLILFPSALWIVAGISTVLRFLNYLDTRIRLEGWEVELTLRAEAERWLAEGHGPTTR
jgi:hypothetical protein